MIRILSFLLLFAATPAMAVDCAEISHRGQTFTTCTVNMATDDLRLFLKDDTGEVIGHFDTLESHLGRTLSFAMNAGMYHDDRAPVGHYVENGEEISGIVPNAGPGNFGMLPNGVFCIREERADVIETIRFQELSPDCRYATQSGPMLVIDGKLHDRFLPDSTFRNIRNGVGTSEDGKTAVFVISETSVTFHEMGTLFQEELGLQNALYFDGRISRLHATDLERSDFGVRMGPIVGVVD